MTVAETPARSPANRRPAWLSGVIVLFLLFIFLCGVRGMGTGFESLGGDLLDSFFQATSNPFVALVVGILGTTLVQSSSVTTSMIVAMVAAPDNPLPIPNAIPMIMGANIGTTVTNTLVALAYVGRPDEFRRAYSAATCHDFFNFMTVALLLPLEMAFAPLQKLSAAAASWLGTGGGGKLPNPLKTAAKAVVDPVKDLVNDVFSSKVVAGVALVVISTLVIFVALMFLVRVLRQMAGGRTQVIINRALDSSPYAGIGVGAIVTVMVQSSSITTSVMVPLAGAGLVTLAQVFPVTLGANLGTTVTAILASMAAPGETAALAVQIAAVHLLFNSIGILLIYPFEPVRRIPLKAATWLAEVGVKSKRLAVLYVVGLFYGLPGVLIVVSRWF